MTGMCVRACVRACVQPRWVVLLVSAAGTLSLRPQLPAIGPPHRPTQSPPPRAVQALGVALKLTFQGHNQLVHPQTYFFIVVGVADLG